MSNPCGSAPSDHFSVSEVTLATIRELFRSDSGSLSESPIFYQPSYLQFIEEAFGLEPRHTMIFAVANRRPLALLPAFEVSMNLKGFSRVLPCASIRSVQSLPFFTPGGLLPIGVVPEPEHCGHYLAGAVNHLTTTYDIDFVRVLEVVFSPKTSCSATLPSPFRTHRWGYWFRIGKAHDVQEIWQKRMSKKARNAVRFAEKTGVNMQTTNLRDSLSLFYDLYRDHYSHLNKKTATRGLDIYEKLSECFGDDVFVMVSYVDREPVGANLFTITGRCLTILNNVSLSRALRYKVNNYLYWKTIVFGWEMGARTFDFGGGPLLDVTHANFKESMGGKPYPILQCDCRVKSLLSVGFGLALRSLASVWDR